MKILMVCLGNICRSPIAEGVLHQKVKDNGLNWVVESAGTESLHVGEHPHRFSVDICNQYGIDISEQRARKFTVADFAAYDKIYALAQDVYSEIKRIGGKDAQMHKVELLLNELYPGMNKSVPDPYYGGQEGFAPVYDLIDAACTKIIENYK